MGFFQDAWKEYVDTPVQKAWDAGEEAFETYVDEPVQKAWDTGADIAQQGIKTAGDIWNYDLVGKADEVWEEFGDEYGSLEDINKQLHDAYPLEDIFNVSNIHRKLSKDSDIYTWLDKDIGQQWGDWTDAATNYVDDVTREDLKKIIPFTDEWIYKKVDAKRKELDEIYDAKTDAIETSLENLAKGQEDLRKDKYRQDMADWRQSMFDMLYEEGDELAEAEVEPFQYDYIGD